MTIQQKLANRIYELLPHKKELMVCSECNGEGWILGNESGHGCNGTDEDCNRTCPIPIQKQIGCEYCLGSGHFETPVKIHLADILRAIEKVNQDMNYVFYQGKFLRIDISNEIYGEPSPVYNLSKDNILDQSDEFCEFVLELLK